MRAVSKAIILNAGEGRRLRPLTLDAPKCLLTVGDYSILENQLSNLAASGINEVTMVIGYLSEKIIKIAREQFPNFEFKFTLNEEYANTNTAYSLWLALQHMDDEFIYLNGDVLFDRRVIDALLNSFHNTCLAVSKHKLTEEEVKVILHDDLVLSIGKHLAPLKADGEFIGVAKFSKKVGDMLKQKLSETIAAGGSKHYFEYALDLILETEDVFAVDISDFTSIEIDTLDLERAKVLAKKLVS